MEATITFMTFAMLRFSNIRCTCREYCL